MANMLLFESRTLQHIHWESVSMGMLMYQRLHSSVSLLSVPLLMENRRYFLSSLPENTISAFPVQMNCNLPVHRCQESLSRPSLTLGLHSAVPALYLLRDTFKAKPREATKCLLYLSIGVLFRVVCSPFKCKIPLIGTPIYTDTYSNSYRSSALNNQM